MNMPAELIVALDVPSVDAITPLLRKLPAEANFFKVGLELFIRDGVKAMALLAKKQKRVFLDLKLHDIPHTVAQAIKAAGRFEAALMTVHAAGGRAMLSAAAEAAYDCPIRPQLIAVTTLTSLNEKDFADLGIQRTLTDQARTLGALALECRIDGLVTSVLEAPTLRTQFGPKPVLVTPGIRPAGADIGDQKRIATPAGAIRAGASYLVVGRPILDAPHPGQAAAAILAEMAEAEAQSGSPN